MLIPKRPNRDFRLDCPTCGQSLVVDQKLVGQTLPCPKCNSDILVSHPASLSSGTHDEAVHRPITSNNPALSSSKKEEPPKLEKQIEQVKAKRKFFEGSSKILVAIIFFPAVVFMGVAIRKFVFEPMGITTRTLGGSLTIQEHLNQAEGGDPAAQLQVGYYYEVGLGVKQDKAKALKWYNKSAQQGNREAIKNLVRLIMDDLGADPDEEWRERLFTAMNAAQNGDVKAQLEIGKMFFSGNRVKQDLARAEGWFTKAANQGCPESREYLERIEQAK